MGGISSISHFHRQLRVLEHSAPEPLVTPAFRLRTVDGSGRAARVPTAGRQVAPKLTVVGADRCPDRPSPSWARIPVGAEAGAADRPAAAHRVTATGLLDPA